MKFSPGGKLLLALGMVDKPGMGTDQFNKPTDVAFGPDGEVYVSDGYGNSRVMKFTAAGKFVKTWGAPGDGPGEFNLPHSIIVDARNRILVGDRENDRVQVFDRDGKLLEIWTDFAPYGLAYGNGGTLFVADGRANKLLRLNTVGKVEQSWGGLGSRPGQFNLPHMLAVDKTGNVYVAEVGGKRLQRFVGKR
jgi:DNA-binding beta-propeller fold protein YncE